MPIVIIRFSQIDTAALSRENIKKQAAPMALPAFSFLFRNGKQSKAQRAAAGPQPFGLLFRPHTGAAGEFLSTEAPISSALDGGGLDGTIKANPMRSPQNAIPNNPSITGHIFRNSPGHLPNTMDNLKLLEDVANDPVCYYGTDKYGTSWYIKIQLDGAQIWVQSRNHVIFDGGLNEVPLQWNADTGLKSLSIERKGNLTCLHF